MSILKFIWHIPRKLLIFFVKIYQKTISPDHGFMKAFFPGGYCKYTPSCSSYAVMSLEKYGAIYGSLKSFYRFLRCNPFSKGGYDMP